VPGSKVRRGLHMISYTFTRSNGSFFATMFKYVRKARTDIIRNRLANVIRRKPSITAFQPRMIGARSRSDSGIRKRNALRRLVLGYAVRYSVLLALLRIWGGGSGTVV
jgi:hypothetical protein